MVDTQVLDLEALYRAPITLRGHYVTLVPLTLEHGEALFSASPGVIACCTLSHFEIFCLHARRLSQNVTPILGAALRQRTCPCSMV